MLDWTSIAGNIGFLIGTTLMYGSPLMMASLGGVVSENAGIVNIGIEGIMTLGALAGATVGYYTGNPWLGLLAGAIAGGLLTTFHAVACVTFKANHVVSGIALNFIGPGLAFFLARMFFNGATQTLPCIKIPQPFKGVFPQFSFLDLVLNQYATVYLAFALVAIVWFLLYKTKLGLRIRAVGEHPKAADTLGVNVDRVQYFATIVGGMLAGVAGATYSLVIISYFQPPLIAGQGFIALAAMIFGKWKPQGAMFACLLFGASQALAIFLGRSDIRTIIQIPESITVMLPYVLTLVMIVTFVGKSVAPAHDGIPYDKGEDAKL